MITNKQLKIVIDSANLYKENLLNKNVVFIYQNMKTGEYSFIESLFLAEHFLHLTGLEINKTKIKNASTFFCFNYSQ